MLAILLLLLVGRPKGELRWISESLLSSGMLLHVIVIALDIGRYIFAIEMLRNTQTKRCCARTIVSDSQDQLMCTYRRALTKH